MSTNDVRGPIDSAWNIGQRPFISHRTVFGTLVVLYKKATLPLVKLPLSNYWEDQIAFNKSVAECIQHLNQFSSVDSPSVTEFLDKLNHQRTIGQRPFTTHRGIPGKLAILYKKVTLPLVRLPLCNYWEDQITFNNSIVECVKYLDQPAFFDFHTAIELADKLNDEWSIGQRPFTTHRGILGKLAILYKKVTLPLVRLPLCNYWEDQIAFNKIVTEHIQYNIYRFSPSSKLANNFRRTENVRSISSPDLANDSYLKKSVKKMLKPLLSPLIRYINKSLIGPVEQQMETLYTILDQKIETIDAKTGNRSRQIIERTDYLFEELDKKLETTLARLRSIDLNSEQGMVLSDKEYYQFTNLFRGDVHLIEERQKEYLEYFKNCNRVIDLGCGRGEFVQLLRNHNIQAIGIDTNREMVEFCKKEGLPVEEADSISYLSKCPENSLDGIFSAQVVEHLSVANVRLLLELAYRALKPDGCCIIETPNPMSLYAYSHYFHLDVTHKKPLHPQALRFLMEISGFKGLEIKFTSPVSQNDLLPEIKATDQMSEDVRTKLEEVNRIIHRLNQVIFGWQDYAVVGRK